MAARAFVFGSKFGPIVRLSREPNWKLIVQRVFRVPCFVGGCITSVLSYMACTPFILGFT